MVLHKNTLSVPDSYINSQERCLATWLGRIDYMEAYELQKKIMGEKINGRPEDILLLLEHPHTITLGKSGKLENLLTSRETLAKNGISLHFVDRGGDITYHGPGQLVVYPIVNLSRQGKDIHRFVFNLQETIIRTLAEFNISAGRDKKYVGVWVGNEKIAAIGIAVHRWVAMHGISINVDPMMEYYNLINPCGIQEKGVTSIARLIKGNISTEKVAEKFILHYSEVFNMSVRTVSPDVLR